MKFLILVFNFVFGDLFNSDKSYKFDLNIFLKNVPAWGEIYSGEFYQVALDVLSNGTSITGPLSESEFDDEVNWLEYRY